MTQPPCPIPTLHDLEPLEDLIVSELQYWLRYLREVRSPEKRTYYEILSATDNTTNTKAQALRHILETLPLRHKALLSAYNMNEISSSLSEPLMALLLALEEETTQVELESWYENRLLKSKKMMADVMAIDAEVRRLEDARREELKGLLKGLEDIKGMQVDGWVGKEEVEGLIAAMDGIGLNADSGVVLKEGHASVMSEDVEMGKQGNSSRALSTS